MIYNVYTKHYDDHGRMWKSFFRLRANGINHALRKANDIFDSIGLNNKWTNVQPAEHQSGVHFIGMTGRLMSVGKFEEDIGFPYGVVRHVIDGHVNIIGELDLNEHEYIRSRVWDKV